MGREEAPFEPQRSASLAGLTQLRRSWGFRQAAAAAVPRVLGVTVVSAADLPKVDTMGRCDGYCVVNFGGQQQSTSPVKNCYDPVWGCEFLFHCGPDAGALTVQVWDWERIGNNRLVGTHVVPAEEMAAKCSGPVGWDPEGEVTVPLFHEGTQVYGYSKRRTTLRLRFRLLEGPSAGPPPTLEGAPKVHRQRQLRGIVRGVRVCGVGGWGPLMCARSVSFVFIG